MIDPESTVVSVVRPGGCRPAHDPAADAAGIGK
jgi:hypothetical protein